MTAVTTLTAAAARRAALAATGLTEPRPSGTPNRRHLGKVLDRIRLLQLDSVNVAVRAHYMPLFSRIGPYPARLLDEAAWQHRARSPRLLVEYWAHEASLLPVGDWPLFRWRMRQFAANRGRWPAHAVAPELAEKVRACVAELGPVGAGELERVLELRTDEASRRGGWWERSEVKRACEWLFAIGELTTGTRVGFQRHYDLPERVLPGDLLDREIPEDEAARTLVRRAAGALGVATEPDLRDYYRLPPAMSQAAVAGLVEDGLLEQVEVRGWRAPAYKPPEGKIPRRTGARALLCPFDPLIWFRERTERLFDFHYRIEIYTPAHKRVHGYYVFPFLLDDVLVARVDLKADRAAGALLVHGAFAEDGVDRAHVVRELAAELCAMADWLELGEVVVGAKGDLARPLRAEL
nr:crosslink repair DNA glycosylase YcaQ family protein [Sciscionella marina]